MTLGIFERTNRGTGFLRRRENAYLPASGDVHVSERAIRRYGLRPGDEVDGQTRSGGKGRGPTLERVTAVNGQPAEALQDRPDFTRMGATQPSKPLRLEVENGATREPNYTNRVIDLLCPFGKGQRALIVAPSKAGKTTVLQQIAEGVSKNHPEALLFILLVDERPEEVYEIEAAGVGEVLASSFDNPPSRHTALAELVLERARRHVEIGGDVVLVVDSLTRLARAYNAVEKGSGRTLSGGLDAQSLEKPKRFFGSARQVPDTQGGGSLTIIATALVDTGSLMDQVIFEEFKGTGNSELVLSRELADRRIFPAIDLQASATRREELLLLPEALAASSALRKRFASMRSVDAMQDLLKELRSYATNAELIRATGKK